MLNCEQKLLILSSSGRNYWSSGRVKECPINTVTRSEILKSHEKIYWNFLKTCQYWSTDYHNKSMHKGRHRVAGSCTRFPHTARYDLPGVPHSPSHNTGEPHSTISSHSPSPRHSTQPRHQTKVMNWRQTVQNGCYAGDWCHTHKKTGSYWMTPWVNL